jgi:hypothetical protein
MRGPKKEKNHEKKEGKRKMIKIRRERIAARINGIIIKTRRRTKRSMKVEQVNENLGR